MAKGSKRSTPKKASTSRSKPVSDQIIDADYDDDISDEEHEQSFQTKAMDSIQSFIGQEDGGNGAWSAEVQAILDMNTLMSLYYNEDWVHICIDRTAQKIAAQKLVVHRRVKHQSSVEIEILHDHQINRLFEQPNDYQDYHAFMYNVVTYYCAIGNVCINHQVISKRLIPLPTENINLRFDHKKQTISSYDVMASSSYDMNLMTTRMSYDPRSIIHIRRPNPGSLIWGLSPFIPARKSVLFARYSQDYLINFYLKGAQPGVILSMDKDANEKMATKLLMSFEKANSGRKNQRKTMMLPKGVTASSYDHTIGDQNLIEYVKNNRGSIIAILGVPPHELGISENASLGSEEYKTALKNWYQGPIRSTQKIIAGAFTRALRSYLGDDLYLDFDNSDVEVLQENKKEKAELAQLMLQTHTINEIRSELYKMDAVEGGDKVGSTQQSGFGGFGGYGGYSGGGQGNFGSGKPSQFDENGEPIDPPKLDAAGKPIPLDSEGAEDPEASGDPEDPKLEGGEDLFPEGEEKTLESGGEAQVGEAPAESEPLKNQANMDKITAYQLQQGPDWWKERTELRDNVRGQAESEIAILVMELFVAQVEAAVTAVGKHLGSSTKAGPDKNSQAARIRRDIDKAAFNKGETIVIDLSRAMEKPSDNAYRAQLIIPTEEVNATRLQALQAKGKRQRRAILEDRSLRSFAWISTSYSEDIMKKVERGIAEKRTVQEIQASIVDDIKKGDTDGKIDPVKRALTIARTEVMTASSIGEAAAMQAAAKIFPKLKKAWISTADLRTRDTHANLQGEVRQWDEKFSNGLMHPHDPTGPKGEVINCRCALLTIPEEDADSIGLDTLDTTLPRKPAKPKPGDNP